MNTETNTPEKEFEPFGPEWEKEMMKWSKPMLIAYLKEKLILLNEVSNPHP